MIATHIPKMFNARLKAGAIASRIFGAVPGNLICSQTVLMRKELFAAPKNAADIKKYREIVANMAQDSEFERVLPDPADTNLKQLLLPLDWRNGEYVSASPVQSAGVTHELYNRLRKRDGRYVGLVIQQNPAAIANHGEALMMQGGVAALMRKSPAKLSPSGWRGDFVQLTARCEKMNISSGMVALGQPAITAIGGFVHSLEREINDDIEFAIGLRNINCSFGADKIILHKNSYGSYLGRARGGDVTPVSGFITDEITGTCEIVLLMRTKSRNDELATVLQRKASSSARIAGGHLFNPVVLNVFGGTAPAADYILDASGDIALERALRNNEIDNLQAAIDIYLLGGASADLCCPALRRGAFINSYTINQTGYAFLERPTSRSCARDGGNHAWVEPVFSLVRYNVMSDECWWARESRDSGVFWRGINAKTG